MGFRRRKNEDRDPFAHLADDREAAESGTPWFIGADTGPELEVEAGISSNLRDEDLERRRRAEFERYYEEDDRA
jgi:hypothetical protein